MFSSYFGANILLNNCGLIRGDYDREDIGGTGTANSMVFKLYWLWITLKHYENAGFQLHG